MARWISLAVLCSVLVGCASPSDAPAANPYGSPDAQRDRAGRTTQELDRSIRY